MSRFCSDCPKSISAASRTGRCRSCCAKTMQSPEIAKRRRSSMIEKMRCPEYRAAHIARTTAGLRAKLEADPAFAANRREMGRRVGLSRLASLHHPAGSEARVRAGRASRETKLAWCPPEYRETYLALVKRQAVPAAQAREMVSTLIDADARRYHRTGELQQARRR